jgi:hypothetical protein
MPKDHRIRLTDREIKLTRDALAVLMRMASDVKSPQESDLRAIFARFDNIKTGGQKIACRDARQLMRMETCPESKS